MGYKGSSMKGSPAGQKGKAPPKDADLYNFSQLN
jgi:hypothetical protein